MDRVNFQAIEKKWQNLFSKDKLSNPEGKNFFVLKCFLIPREKYTWGT